MDDEEQRFNAPKERKTEDGRVYALINTGSGRNLGDRSMLLALTERLKWSGGSRIYAPIDVPAELVKEFGLQGYPLLHHCLGVLNLQARTALSRFAFLSGAMVVALALIILRRVAGRPLPWQFSMVALINALADVDGVVFAGGGYLTDEGQFECHCCLITGLLGHLLGKPIFMVGQGVGPVKTMITRFLVGRVANRARFISVRDAESRRTLEGLVTDATFVHATVDDAIDFGRNRCPPRTDPKTLAVHFRASNFVSGDRVQAELAQVIKMFRSDGWKIRYFIFNSIPEQELDHLRSLDPVVNLALEVIADVDPRVVRRNLAECTVAIGFAYHFLVFALGDGVPVLGLYEGDYYRQKLVGLLDWFERRNWAVKLDSLDAGQLRKSLQQMTLERARQTNWLKGRADELVLQQSSIYAAMGLRPSPPLDQAAKESVI